MQIFSSAEENPAQDKRLDWVDSALNSLFLLPEASPTSLLGYSFKNQSKGLYVLEMGKEINRYWWG